ncbi:MAG: hypothetical protein CVT86_02460 [Alphaproteobacteria bacterium HGW-Alphaproteobacteria-8]|nr:MAG: hypothetical protein CVT86_02460 [Alphaproteobacteria bacterium HGW-Alphaproteobacteria-8]
MPADLIGPRVLTPGGLLVLGGAPKVGKSDLLIAWLVHMAAGVPFLGFTPPRPLRIFYLQAEIQYHYLRERMQQIGLRGHDGLITTGTVCFRPGRFDGGGMRYLRFTNWLTEIDRLSGPVEAIWFEEVRRHAGTDAAHVYGGLMATLTAWAELRGVPYEGVPVGTIKRFATGKGNANKDAMIAAARARGFSPADDNEADAIAILMWAIETKGGLA